jgi:hypothetical protein
MRYILLFAFSWILFVGQAGASQKYWVFFKDKGSAGIPVQDKGAWYDLPVHGQYLDQVHLITDSLGYASAWLNAVIAWAGHGHLPALQALPFVQATRVAGSTSRLHRKNFNKNMPGEYPRLAHQQLDTMGKNYLQARGLDGQGLRVAVFDAGFRGVNTSPVFEHLRTNNQIVKTYDFVKDEVNVYHASLHGAMVLSCIAGKAKDTLLGLATGAEFLLARTETFTEGISEEENWVAAMEWAAENGANIISNSLGYTYHRYFEHEMDGQTSLVAKVANIAAEKGILVISSAGNDGASRWEYISTPADADSVLTIGAIDPRKGYHISFSSFGPTADMRLKPNLTAFGQAVVSGWFRMRKVSGTSFSCPLVTGLAACLWQGFPEWDNMELFRQLEKSGSLYPYYDYAHGYGVPSAKAIFDPASHENSPPFEFRHSPGNDSVKVWVFDDCLPNDEHQQVSPLFYHLANPGGVLTKYALVKVEQNKVLEWPVTSLEEKILRVHFKGHTLEYK